MSATSLFAATNEVLYDMLIEAHQFSCSGFTELTPFDPAMLYTSKVLMRLVIVAIAISLT
jgi:hypothetical protein